MTTRDMDMPRIQDYGAPEVEASVPLEISSQRIEEAGQMGRAISSFGTEVENLASAHYRNQARQEVSNAQVQWSEARADAQNQLDQQIREGKVDTEKLTDDFQKYVDKNQDQYQTAHGRQVFNYQAARTRSMLLRTAVHAQSVLAGQQATDNRIAAMDNDSNAVESHPENFADIYGAHMAGIEEDVNSGALPATLEGKAKHEAGSALAVGAIKGWAKLDPDKAQKILDSGAFDTYFNAEKKDRLEAYIHSVKSAQETDLRRQDFVEKKAAEKREEAWKIAHIEGIENGTLSAKEIMKAGHSGELSYQGMKEQLAMLEHVTKERTKPNYALRNELTQRIYADDSNPNKIKYISQIDEYAAKGLLDIPTRNSLVKALSGTEEGKTTLGARKQLNKFMEKQLAGKDEMLGVSDPHGGEKLSDAYTMLEHEEEVAKKAGTPMKEVYDKFYSTVLQMKPSGHDIMKSRTDLMRAQSGAKTAVEGADKTKAVFTRLPNESMDAWIKRRRGGQ